MFTKIIQNLADNKSTRQSAYRIRIVAGGLEGRGFVQLVGLVLLRVLVLEQVEPVLLLSPAFLAVAGHFREQIWHYFARTAGTLNPPKPPVPGTRGRRWQ